MKHHKTFILRCIDSPTNRQLDKSPTRLHKFEKKKKLNIDLCCLNHFDGIFRCV